MQWLKMRRFLKSSTRCGRRKRNQLNKELDEEDEPGKVLEEEDENKLPVFEGYHLKDLIDLRIKQIQQERGEEFTPIDEMEKRKIKVTKKTQTIFETPLPTKDPELVEEVIKVLIGHIESKMNTKIDGFHTPKNETYEELDKRLQLWYLERNNKRTVSEGLSESFTKKNQR